MKHIKSFENSEETKSKVWLLPTDDRYEKSLKSIPELRYSWREILDDYDYNFLDESGYNPNYIYIGSSKTESWFWYDFSEEGLNFLKNNIFMGPVNISKDEYDNAILQLVANKYNL
jgi:hypothetical protein